MRYLIDLWPALFPIIAYFMLMHRRRKDAEKGGFPKPRFSEGPWYTAVFASVGVALLLLIWIGATAKPNQGEYVPPQYKEGTLSPGHIEKDKK